MFDFIKLGFAEVQWIVVTAIGIYAWVVNKHSASAKELLALHLRVVEVENAVKDMPSKIDIARMEGELTNMSTKIEATNKSIDTVQRGVVRIENHLLEAKK